MNVEEQMRIESKENCGHGDDSTAPGMRRSPGASHHLVIQSMHQARDIVLQRQRDWQNKAQRPNTGFHKVDFFVSFTEVRLAALY